LLSGKGIEKEPAIWPALKQLKEAEKEFDLFEPDT
jgi:hypothetical protein